MKRALKSLFPALIILFSTQHLTAQDKIPVELKPIRVSVGILEPSVIAEFRLTDRQSFAATGGVTFAFSESDGYVFPFVRGSFRHYYDRKRVKKSNLRTNSGNFVTLQGGYYFESFNDDVIATSLDNYFFIGPAWGIQRNYNSGIHLSLSLGFGYGNGSNSNGSIASTGHFTFGFTFN
jgi:hypothetical protein